jgi:chitinase
MGIPFYGRAFVLTDETKNKGGPDSVSSGDGFAGPYTQENGFLSYYEICKMIKDDGNW